ncbi:MAG TPA: DUF1800 domain-containing protein [Ramlibacter sp.]|nr:DUF1800 domain-containing protein [Ramlibacter sp.]
MRIHPTAWAAGLCACAITAPALAATLTLEISRTDVPLGGSAWLLGKVDGQGRYFNMAVNGIPGGNAKVGTVNSQNGHYVAPTAMPMPDQVTISGSPPGVSGSASVVVTLRHPAAVLTGVTPAKVGCGGPFAIQVRGTGFLPQTQLLANGKALALAASSATLLAANVATVGGGSVTLQAVNPGNMKSGTLRLGVDCALSPAPAPPPAPAPAPAPVPAPAPAPAPAPQVDAATVAAARLLEQATFGPTLAALAAARQLGETAWIAQQLALAPTPVAATNDRNEVMRNWYLAMATAPDQLRQRMVFALSQIFVVSFDKNPYGNEVVPWLQTLNKHAFGHFEALLREMTLNPAMGKYLDLGNSIMPAPNENYAREVMQLFTVGLHRLHMDGTPVLDASGQPVPTYDQARIADMAKALSGWTYAGSNAGGINWENFSGPLQPRNGHHHPGAKTLLMGQQLPAGQGIQQDMDAAMANLFNHPNLPPFIAQRLIRHFVTSNPSPQYVARVATVFAGGSGTARGDLAATVRAVLLDPEARSAVAAPTRGRLKDPLLHTIGLARALGAQFGDPTNLMYNYYVMGQRPASAPSVFGHYPLLGRLPGSPELYGPEFHLYSPSYAVYRADFIYGLLGGYFGSMLRVDLAPFVQAAPNATALINLVDATLLQGRMSPATRQGIGQALAASTDSQQRAITALYLAAMTADYTVYR